MTAALLSLLLLQQPAHQDNVLWSFKTGQEFFVEETQRQLLQVKSPSPVTSYLDYTYLWRYFVDSEKNGQFKVQATLEKVRVNNPNEAGAKACELIKQNVGSKSSWLLVRNESGWIASPFNGEPGKHAEPYFLTLGTAKLTDEKDSWKQRWKVPVSKEEDTYLDLTITIKQRVNDKLLTTVKAKMAGSDSNTDAMKLVFEPSGTTLAGLGEYDFNRSRWNYFECRVEGFWYATRQGTSVVMKQNSYCSYRLFERRPTFP